MSVSIPVLAILGRKKSGKTTVIEALVSELTRRRLHVASAKHVSRKGFSIDTEGKDTWRYSAVGANPVIIISDTESVIKVKNRERKFTLERMLKVAEEYKANSLVLEGFSFLVLEDVRVGKIICVRNMEEYREFREKARGEVLAFCSLQPLEAPVLNMKNSLPDIIEKAVRFIEKGVEISEILHQLAGLDCRKCGRATCEELAKDIYENRASLEDCLPLKLKPELRTKITVGGSEIPTQPFVSEIIRKSILGMVSTLKGVTVKGDEEVNITISRQKPKA